MYLRVLFGLTAVALLTFLLSPVSYSQFQGGGFPSGGKGGFSGKGGRGNPGGTRSADPTERFNAYSKGRPFFLISDATPGTQYMLKQYAQEKNVQFSNDQVTREQFMTFDGYVKDKFASGGMFGRGARQNPPGTIGTPNGPMPVGNGAPTLEQLQQLSDAEFKSRDENGDGKLNMDEMPGSLKRDLARWDLNKDGMIDQTEYRGYFMARAQERLSGSSSGMQPANPVEAVLDDELDKRPTVYRAGKLPAQGLPPWFSQLDTDADGQVALYEWRAGGRDLDEFGEWDKDNDGFITPEEALKVQAVLTKSPNPLLASNAPSPGNRPGMNGPGGGPRGFNMQGPQGGRNWGGPPSSTGGPPQWGGKKGR